MKRLPFKVISKICLLFFWILLIIFAFLMHVGSAFTGEYLYIFGTLWVFWVPMIIIFVLSIVFSILDKKSRKKILEEYRKVEHKQ